MPIITLPGGIRDTITRSSGQELQKRIANGKAAADITYVLHADTANRSYRLEFKSAKGETLSVWRADDDGTDWTKPIPLYPDLSSELKTVSKAVDIGEGGMFLLHWPGLDNAKHRFRVELSPPGSSAVYMALEAEGREGEIVAMQSAELYPNEA